MSYKPLITVAVPAYNHEKYINDCLNSILNEDYPNKELIIINDGSTDNTDEVIQEWINKNSSKIPITYINQENIGLTATLNKIFDTAKGEYLACIASDDYFLNNGISKRFEYLNNNPDKMAVFGDCIVVDDQNKLLHNSGLSEHNKLDKNKMKTDSDLRIHLIKYWGVPGPVLMLKTEIFNKIGKFDETLSVEDKDLYLRMISQNLLGFIDETVSAYRWHGGNSCDFKNICDSLGKQRRDNILNDLAKISLKYIHLFNWKEKYLLFENYVNYKTLFLFYKKESNIYLNFSHFLLLIIRKSLKIFKLIFLRDIAD